LYAQVYLTICNINYKIKGKLSLDTSGLALRAPGCWTFQNLYNIDIWRW